MIVESCSMGVPTDAYIDCSKHLHWRAICTLEIASYRSQLV
jgi:hypothetical protein